MRLIVALLTLAAAGSAVVDAHAQQECPYDSSDAVADTLDPAGYYPLQEGNVWEYEARIEPWLESVYRIEVMGDTLISDTLFSKLSRAWVRWPGGAIDPHQPGAVSDTSYLYQAMADGVLLDWHHLLGIIERFDFNRPFRSCYGGEGKGDFIIVGGTYPDTVAIEGATGEVEGAPVSATKSFGERFAGTRFAYGIGDVGGGVETTTISLRYARVDSVEYGRAFSGVFSVDTERPDDPNSVALRLEPYPNPATFVMHVNVQVGTADRVTIDVIDVLGRRVALLADEIWLTGTSPHHKEWLVRDVPAGTYVVRARATHGGFASAPVLVVH